MRKFDAVNKIRQKTKTLIQCGPAEKSKDELMKVTREYYLIFIT